MNLKSIDMDFGDPDDFDEDAMLAQMESMQIGAAKADPAEEEKVEADKQEGDGAEDDGQRKIDRIGCFEIELVADPDTGK